VVMSVSSEKPSKLRWKLNSSGIYQTKTGELAAGHEYDSPGCQGDPVSGGDPDDVFGPAWDHDKYGNDGDVYRDD